jgi:hypothetical protein
MIASIMQPYLFPYVGYFQLLRNSDIFVAYDDVQYMKGGWINRNNILVNCSPSLLSLPVISASYTLQIKERSYQLDESSIEKVLRKIESAYRKAPNFDATFELISGIMAYKEQNVAAFNINSLRRIAEFLNITTSIISSSDLRFDFALKGPERVIDICKVLHATRYVNPIGGVSLYRASDFRACGIGLYFLKPKSVPSRRVLRFVNASPRGMMLSDQAARSMI